MQIQQLLSYSPAITMSLGKTLAHYAKPGDIFCLYGDLGSGKTTLVKGIANGFGIDPVKVNSPTFVLMNAYQGRIPMYHFDFYRLERTAEIAAIGYEEFLYGSGVSVIEWSERFGNLAPKERLSLRFVHQGEDKRLIEFSAQGQRYQELLQKMRLHEISRA